MNPSVRRATPDSEAVASSEDERPWPAAPSFGSFPRRENGVPGLGGGIWSTQKRGSFKMEKAAHRNAAREARLGAPTQHLSGLRAEGTPSPAASDGSAALPFSIPLQPAPKAGRSMSHSQGQRDFQLSSGIQPSSTDHASVLPLGLLTEEVDTESESEFGGSLTHTTSHPPIGTLQRTSTYPLTYDAYYGGLNGKEPGETAGGEQAGSKGDRRFEAAFANLSLAPDHLQRRSQWQSHLGWEDVPNVNESRRHSLADIPTRRGSLAAAESRVGMGGGPVWLDNRAYAWENGIYSFDQQKSRDTAQLLLNGVINPGLKGTREQTAKRTMEEDPIYDLDQFLGFEIPSMYKVPHVELADHERSEQDRRAEATMSPGSFPFGPNRPRKQLYIVSFKCSRADCFYLLENTGLMIKEGDIVIVEADRGQDLGTVQHANVTPDDAKLYKRKYGEEQYKWLMMFSKNNNQGSVNPNAQVYGENNSSGSGARGNMLANAPTTMQGLPRDNFNNLKPKAIKRLASAHEIRMLSEKEGNEAKAKRTCQQKVAHLHLDMEILDAEWQWDFAKLIFYYYADHYINFKDLITELYRIYKTRIWLSAINPASFSQHALGQPPSGIGPGAMTGPNAVLNNTYTMMYGPDPDPYGAVPPYRIGYDTYTPNYPAIPGVANSFAPPGPMPGAYQPYSNNAGNAASETYTSNSYGSYYDRSGADIPPPSGTDGSRGLVVGAPPPPTNPYLSAYPLPYLQATSQPNQFYNAFGGNQAMQQQGLNSSMTNVASAGFGRQTSQPAPIGTTNATPGSGNYGMRTGAPGRIAPDFVPGQHYSLQGSTFLGGVRNAPISGAPHGSNFSRFGGGSGSETDSKDAHANEMSRER